jgi:hypothetical protein
LKFTLLGFAICFCLLPFYGCEKKQELTPPQKTQQFAPVQAPIQTPMDKPAEKPRSPHGNMSTKGERKIILPPEIKSSWTGVKFIFEDRNTKKQSEYTAKLGSEMTIPGTELKIVFSHFLPDFKMERDVITSKSTEPNNPAVRVEIYEKGKTIFTGWLYAKYPEIHAFEHHRYGIVLKEGIRRL